MKKLLLSFAVIMFAAASAVATNITFDFLTEAYGMTRYSGNSSSYNPADTTITQEVIAIGLHKGDITGHRLWSDGVRFTKAPTEAGKDSASVTIRATEGNITAIEVTTSKSVSSMKLVTDGKFTVEEGATKNGKWEGSSNSVKFIMANDATMAIATLVITVEGVTGAKKEAEIVVAEGASTGHAGQVLEPRTITKATTAELKYASSNEDVLTVDATGKVVLVGPGTANVKITAEANDQYYAGTASYSVYVAPALPTTAFAEGLYFGLDGWTIDNEDVAEDVEVWKWNDSYHQAMGSAYGKGAAVSTLISPVFSLENHVNCAVQFDHAAKFQTNFRELCQLVIREAGASEWTVLPINVYPAAGAWTFDTNTTSIKDFDGKQVEIGFRFQSTEDNQDSWYVQNFCLVDGFTAGIANVEAEAIDAAPVYYNMQGMRVANPSNGIFIVVKGNRSSKVIL